MRHPQTLPPSSRPFTAAVHILFATTFLLISSIGTAGFAQAIDQALEQLRAGNYLAAIAAGEAGLKENPDDTGLKQIVAQAHQEQGVKEFYAGNAKASVTHFDAFLKHVPEREPHHWQRGLSQYYAGEFAKGVAQFEKHQIVNGTDVENAVWHVACMVKNGRSLAEAQANMYPFAGDSRVPMEEIHALFKGTGSREAVLAAAKKSSSKRQQNNSLCYAYLYLGLFEEINRNSEQSLADMKRAAEDYKHDHYMGKTAQVHYKLRQVKTK